MEYIDIIPEVPFELDQLVPPELHPKETQQTDSSSKPFIEANTEEVTLSVLQKDHIIPVFVKDNEPLISHAEFIEAAQDMVADVFHGEHILRPSVRISHPVKGRIPEAKDKPASQLADWEKTVYYERMMFVIEIPSISSQIDGNQLSLTVGGVKAYNADNLYSRNQSDQHFKIFVGFKNKVCSNLCVWTDGLLSDVKVKSIGMLTGSIKNLLQNYNQSFHLYHLEQLAKRSITEQQFAHLIGRCRMYPHLPTNVRSELPQLLFGDQMMASVVRDYYKDGSFCRDAGGNINLWKLYNLFTGANKSSYIDQFLDRSVNAFQLVEQIKHGLEYGNDSWYLN